MAQNDILKRFLDAGIAFTAMTQARAEAIVRDLVSAGEVQGEQLQTIVAEVVDRSRENSERLLEQVRKEVRDQVKGLGLATRDDVERLERRMTRPAEPPPSSAKKASAKKAPAKKATSRTATSKKATSRTATSKKAPAKKAASKKAASKKAPAKKATSKSANKGKASTKRAPARKRTSAAKRS